METSKLGFISFERYVQAATEGYEKALKRAEGLGSEVDTSCNPLKLGIELNMSVFYYEIKNDTKKAIEIARKTYNNIENQLHKLQSSPGKGDEYNDAATIMQLLYENLNMWHNELQEETNAKDDKVDL